MGFFENQDRILTSFPSSSPCRLSSFYPYLCLPFESPLENTVHLIEKPHTNITQI